ncbi:MAG: HAMP domain-containing sensor histidine kinase [Gemmatimonadales bacterium]
MVVAFMGVSFDPDTLGTPSANILESWRFDQSPTLDTVTYLSLTAGSRRTPQLMVRASAHGLLERVSCSARSLLAVRLLGLARPVAESHRVLDVDVVVDDCAKPLRVLLGRGISLVIERASVSLTVRADADELAQVLVNLAANARDAMGPNGAVRIAAASDAGRAVITVADRGRGIDPAVRERVFEPFFTTKPSGGGTGIGLNVVYNVVTGLGGKIEASRPWRSTCASGSTRS